MPNQQQGGMFSRYNGEQVNQIPQGYIEGKSAWGRMAQGLGDTALKMRMDYENRQQQAAANAIAQNRLELEKQAQVSRDKVASATELYKSREAAANATAAANKTNMDLHALHNSNYQAARSTYSSAQQVIVNKDSTPEQKAQAQIDMTQAKQQMDKSSKAMYELTSSLTTAKDVANSLNGAVKTATPSLDGLGITPKPLPGTSITTGTPNGAFDTSGWNPSAPSVPTATPDESFYSEG